MLRLTLPIELQFAGHPPLWMPLHQHNLLPYLMPLSGCDRAQTSESEVADEKGGVHPFSCRCMRKGGFTLFRAAAEPWRCQSKSPLTLPHNPDKTLPWRT
jgi:hypothetical protein